MGLFVLLLAACTTDPSQDGAPDPNLLVSLEVRPNEVTLGTGPDGGETQQFAAWATLEDGSQVELDVAAWSVSNSSAGAVDDVGLFSPADDNGGITWVTAEYANTWASATVTVIYHEELVEDGADTSLFTGSAQALEADPWLYPEHGVRLPRGTPSIHFQWADLGADAYRLHFESAVSDIVVYTKDFGWESQAALWQVIAATNAGGAVEVTLSASIDGQLFEADPLELLVNRMDTRGTIYYWTSTLQGVSRIDDEGQAEAWWSIDDMGGYCVGCHAISPGIDPLLTYSARPTSAVHDPDAPREGWLEVRSLLNPEQTVMTMADGQSGDFKSFDPDGELMLTSLGCSLLLFEGRSGQLIADVTPSDPGSGDLLCIAQAEWSPEGDQVAMVVANDDLGVSWEIDAGALYLMDYQGDHSFGEPSRLVDPHALYGDDAHIAYYPAWSPDGAWLAFNSSTGDSYDDPDAELWVVSSGGGTPIVLAAANMGSGLTNSWPRWSPLPDDDILWLTFSSRRDYGYTATDGEPQVWVSAFDPIEAEAGRDPSSPAFWLVGQDPFENNHVPVWIEQ